MKAFAIKHLSNSGFALKSLKSKPGSSRLKVLSVFSAGSLSVRRKPNCPCGSSCPRCVSDKVFDTMDGPVSQTPSLSPTPAQQTAPQPRRSANPCPSAARLDAVRQFNHSNLPANLQGTFKTYLGAVTRMNLLPGPDHTGNCMKEKLSLFYNNCPASLTSRTDPCSAQACLPLNQSGGDSPTGALLSAGTASFLDLHRSRSQSVSFLEGTGVNSCSSICLQEYYCNTYSGPRVAGTFLITRNFQAGTHTPPGGTPSHITTGSVTKDQLEPPPPEKGDFPLRVMPEGVELA